mgnify:CR=1 FL=1
MTIEESLNRLIKYIESENYRGWDPYDGLKSSIFRLPLFKNNKLIRFGVQQIIKRSPINLRRVLFIPKGYNPVTLGLCIQGYTNLYKSNSYSKTDCNSKIEFLIDELQKLIPNGYSGACWGYDFDWEARYAKIPAYQPTVVATGIITNALFECYTVTGNLRALELCKSASKFVLNDLKRTYEGETFCFSYSPFDQQQVFNASMKGVRLLSQVYSVTKDEEFRLAAQQAVRFVVNHQNDDGSWFYANRSTSKWVDNYHTGYVLDCLKEYINCTGDNTPKENLSRGFNYYKNNFFEKGYQPKFYEKSFYPLDCTSIGQSLLTLCKFEEVEKAKQVSLFAIESMQSKKGYFYFRKFRYYTQKTSFMRWSNAWMMAGLSYLLYKEKSK